MSNSQQMRACFIGTIVSAISLISIACSKSADPFTADGVTIVRSSTWVEVTGPYLADFKAGFADRANAKGAEVLKVWTAAKNQSPLLLSVAVTRIAMPADNQIAPEQLFDVLSDQAATNIPNAQLSQMVLTNGSPAVRLDLVHQQDGNPVTTIGVQFVHRGYFYNIVAAGKSDTYDQYRSDIEAMIGRIQLQ